METARGPKLRSTIMDVVSGRLAMALTAAETTAFLAAAEEREAAGDLAAAGAACLRVLAADPRHAEARHRLTRVSMARGQPQAVPPTMPAAAMAGPAGPPPATAGALALDGDEAPFEAVIGMVTAATVGAASRVLARRPAAESDFIDWALYFVRRGEVARAVELYEVLLQADPDNPLAAHMLAAAKGEHALPRAADAYILGLFD